MRNFYLEKINGNRQVLRQVNGLFGNGYILIFLRHLQTLEVKLENGKRDNGVRRHFV
jgi:hypothetical protein